MNKVLGYLAAASLFVLTGCSLDFSQEKTVSPDDIPLLVMDDFVQTTVQNGRALYTVTGKRAENYNTKQQILLKDFSFQEYDESGKVVSQGKAENATVHTATNDASLTGTLDAQSYKQGVSLTVRGGTEGGIDWVNKDKLMSTRDGSQVLLKKDDGSRISAAGMVLNLKTNQLILDKAVTGLWKTETKTNEASTTAPADTPSPAPGP